jgi:prophage regulatory protein
LRLIRLREVLELIPVSKSTWWVGIKRGKYRQPIKLGPRLTCWRLRDVLELTEKGAHGSLGAGVHQRSGDAQ